MPPDWAAFFFFLSLPIPDGARRQARAKGLGWAQPAPLRNTKNTPGGPQTRRGCRAWGTHTQERVWNHQAGAGRWELWQKGGQPLEELVLVGLPLGHALLGAGQEGRGQGGALLLPGGEEADRAGRGIH